ncbi:hypothetical protein IJI70_01965 [Candidatus Saccharibacteria bacterium]|nr:hypothetical protein [Candidatus Saccharibacteria bacterium]
MRKLHILRATAEHPCVALENLEKIINRHLEDGAELLSPPDLVPCIDTKADFASHFVAYATIRREAAEGSTMNVHVF